MAAPHWHPVRHARAVTDGGIPGCRALFNETAFVQQLALHGVKIAQKPAARAVVNTKLPAIADPISALAGSHGFDQHLRYG